GPVNYSDDLCRFQTGVKKYTTSRSIHTVLTYASRSVVRVRLPTKPSIQKCVMPTLKADSKHPTSFAVGFSLEIIQ
ncbi:MAG TPA: hypothetical protein PLY72_15085, partial [Candidatus Obscuribacter sp.]|nr:hypothetical protein [Candidatus Obscuribacter sp.]